MPDAADIDWSYWRTKVEPELVDKFQDALKRTPSGLSTQAGLSCAPV